MTPAGALPFRRSSTLSERTLSMSAQDSPVSVYEALAIGQGDQEIATSNSSDTPESSQDTYIAARAKYIQHAFSNNSCGSFGWFRPQAPETLAVLSNLFASWQYVDLLILPLTDLVDLAKVGDESPHDQSGEFLVADGVLDRPQSREASQDPFRRGRSSTIRSLNSTRIKSLLGLRSVSRQGSLGNQYDPESETPINQLHSVLNCRTKYRIAEVNLLSVYQQFRSEITGLMSFSMFIVQKVTQDFAAIKIPMSGFHFIECMAVYNEFPGLAACLDEVFSSLRHTWVFKDVPIVIMVDEFGLVAWDRIRASINGIVLHNLLVEPSGEFKIMSNADRVFFDKQMTLLKAETSTRRDFKVFVVEATINPLQFHILNYLIKFNASNNFCYWTPRSFDLNLVADLAPNEYKFVSTDLLEIATAPPVMECHAIAERTYTNLAHNNLQDFEFSSHHWEVILKYLQHDPCELWSNANFTSSLQSSSVQDFTANLYQRIEFPVPQAPHVLLSKNDEAAIIAVMKTIESPGAYLSFPNEKVGIQHKPIGTPIHPTRQLVLSNIVLKVMWDLKSKGLLGSVRYNNDLGSDSEKFAERFLNMLNLFEAIMDPERVTPASLWVFSLLDADTQVQVMYTLRMLVVGLRKNAIQVWTATKVAFIPKDGNEGIPHDPMWALTEERDGKLYMFVSDGHPCMEEAVLHAFVKHLGFRSGVCVMVEALISAQNDTSLNFKVPVPLRIVKEVKAASRSKLMALIRNGSAVMNGIQLSSFSVEEAEYLTTLALYVNQCAEHILVVQEGFNDTMNSFLDVAYIPNTDIEEQILQYLGNQTRSNNGLGNVSQMHKSISRLLCETKEEPEITYALCCLAYTIRKALRRGAYLELFQTITTMSTQILPEPDQVAVCLEMATTQTTLQEIFCLSSLQLAPIFHREQRFNLFDEGQKEKGTKMQTPRVRFQNLEYRKGVMVANSYIYVYPVLLDLIFNACLSSGLFVSDRMDTKTFQAATTAFLVSFPFIGALMNSFGRTMSFYFYQLSIPVMIASVSHRLAASFAVLLSVSFLVALFIWLFVAKDWVLMVMGGLHAFCFGLFMIMYAVLVAFRDLSVPFYKSAGPIACVQSIGLLVFPPLISRFAFNDRTHGRIVWAIYIVDMFLVVVFMVYRYSHIAKDFLDWPNAVKVTKKETIFQGYETIIARPSAKEFEPVGDFDQRVRRWEREATEWFSDELNKALHNPVAAVSTAVKERVRQFQWERPLMAWFMQRSSIEPDSVKMFSSEWDSLANQAVEALSRKYQVDKLHRGALLLHLESPAIVFGFLYFIVIFIDKVALLVGTGHVTDLNESEISVAVGFATMYLLLAAGFLELTITAVAEQVNKFTHDKVSSVDNPLKLVSQYQAFTSKVYRKEIFKLSLRAFLVFIVVTSGMVIYAYVKGSAASLMWKYIAESFSLTGLLVGLLNKMFVTANEHLINKFLAVAIIAGVVISSTLIRVLGDANYALLATGLGCWGFAVCCLVARYYERTGSPYYDVSISPSLRTSGQRAIGFNSNTFVDNQLDLYASKLMSEKEDFYAYSPFSSIGRNCIARLRAAVGKAQQFGFLPETTQELVWMLNTSIECFQNGSVVVRGIPGRLEAGGVLYSAIAAKHDKANIIEVFVANLRDVKEAEKVKVICDAIIHEVAEAFGWSHTRACAMEILMESCLSDTLALPSRVKKELTELAPSHRDRIVSRTEAELVKHTCFGVDIDRHWTGDTFSANDREFFVFVAKEWNSLIARGATNQSIVELCDNAPPLLSTNLTALNGLDIPLSCMLEHCILMSYITDEIATQALATEASGTFTPAVLTPSPDRSVLKRISDTINIHMAVSYFALTCDTLFTREVSSLSPVSRIPLCLLYCFNQTIYDQINNQLLFRHNKVITSLRKRAKRGTSRIHSFKNSTTLSHISVFEGTEIVSTASVYPFYPVASDVDSTTELWELMRYAGKKPHRWDPTQDSEKPIGSALVRKTLQSVQIVHEKTIDKNGVVTSMQLYTYPGSGEYPINRYVYNQEVECGWLSADAAIQETHRFFMDGPLAGLVQFADLMRTNKQSKQKMVITVEFEYRLPLTGKIPSRGIFRRSGLPNWGMVIDYAPYSDFRSPLQPLSVRYWDDFSGTVVTTITKFDYSHPKHVVMKTVLLGGPLSKSFNSLDEESPTPIEILEDHFGVMNLLPCKSIFDSCELLTKNLKAHTHREFTPSKWPFLKLHSIEYSESPYSTRHQRDILWASWRAGEIPGVLARILDQNILRSESTLRKYWMYRFMGRTNQAVQFLEDNRELFNNVLYVADKPATRTRLQIRFSDLLIMGNGGDSEMISSFEQSSASVAAEVNESREGILEAICLDSGTWPTGGGGVGSCRRDLVDSLNRVRWTAIAEIAVMELEHKDYQIEKNIRSITYLPLFDNDFGNPMENFYKTTLFAELRDRSIKTTDEVVVTQFLPLVTQLVDACMTGNLDSRRIQEDEQMVVGLYQYFRVYDWKLSWDHPLTQKTWVRLMLNKAKELEQNGTLLGQESPTLAHISVLFTLIVRLLLVLSKEIPNIPVVHVSHHGTQSLIAVISKIIHGSSVIIWDHGMLWRERLFALCRDGMPPYTQIGLIGFTRLCTRLAYHRADYVTPCTNIQNVLWASHLAGGKYLNDAERAALVAKSSAVLNGMNLKKFSIRRELARKTPTAVMLSHLSPMKDVLNAIQAAYHIVHDFKLTSYQLHVYGSLTMDVEYTEACKVAIKDLNLESNVTLKGLGNPALVLPTGWIFVNSSITEGLPLAIGEASLCGLPVVCTNVGGSLEVVSDLKTGALYGAIVPPSRSRQLALAQLKVLGMTDGLDSFVDPSRSESPMVSIQDLIASPQSLETRIMDPEIGKLREQLGEMFSKKTQSVFSIARYCREHEQVLWLGELYSRHKRILQG
ncbi:hypothetical protein BDR26DRAFT_855462 [Obelidium mucronatum]|nr:hypothetical protein BDR26DRAFT_855462 [Obelidium mucronatum]